MIFIWLCTGRLSRNEVIHETTTSGPIFGVEICLRNEKIGFGGIAVGEGMLHCSVTYIPLVNKE